MKKNIEITLQIESREFVIEDIEPVSKKNMLLMKLKNKRENGEKIC